MKFTAARYSKQSRMKKKSNVFGIRIKTAQALFFLNAFLWIGFGVYILFDMAVINNNGLAALIVALFMFGNAGGMLLGGITIGKGIKWAYYFSIALLAVNLLLTLADQFGYFDLLTLLIDLALLWLLTSSGRDHLLQP